MANVLLFNSHELFYYRKILFYYVYFIYLTGGAYYSFCSFQIYNNCTDYHKSLEKSKYILFTINYKRIVRYKHIYIYYLL